MPLPTPTPTSTAVVTGASSGIGADLARELASRGHGVTLVARCEDRIKDLAAELKNVRVEVIGCDVADPQARANLFDEVERRGLTVDVLVNNAGIGTVGPVADSTVDAEIAQGRVNVEAVIDLTTRAVQQRVRFSRWCPDVAARSSTSDPPLASSRSLAKPATWEPRPSSARTPTDCARNSPEPG
jgi:uncharacterized protein